MARVALGQVWASTDSRDVRQGLRQRRRVVDFADFFVWLETDDCGATRVRRDKDGAPRGYRLVEE